MGLRGNLAIFILLFQNGDKLKLAALCCIISLMRLLLTLCEQDINPDAPIVDTSHFRKRQAARVVVIDDKGRVALLRVGKYNYHKLPGGGVEEGESISQALDRELLEEIGCQAKVVAELGQVVEYRDFARLHQISYSFLAKLVGEIGQPNFTEKELSQQFEVIWADNIDSAIGILKNDNPQDLEQEFMKRRDLSILRAGREKLLLTETDHQSQYPNTFYRVSLKAVIRNEQGQVLVNKEHDSDTWSLPGGGWDHGETEHEALARELYEEVGFKGDFTSKPLATQVFWLESKQAWLLWIVFEFIPDNFDFSIGDYSTELAFIDPKSFRNSRSQEERWIYENLS